MDDEWISAAEAYGVLNKVMPGKAAEEIFRRASDELVRARAKRLISRNRSEDDCEIPKSFWVQRWRLSARWESARFEGMDESGSIWRAHGVEFWRADVESIVPKRGPPRREDAEPERQGGRPRSPDWAHWIAELVAEIHANGFPAGRGSEGKAELMKRVEESLAYRGQKALSRNTVEPVVHAVLRRLREPPEG